MDQRTQACQASAEWRSEAQRIVSYPGTVTPATERSPSLSMLSCGGAYGTR